MATDWDDLRFFLAVARAGSIRGAAARLAVNHSTVSRRVAGFEDRVGVRLFERLPTGYVLTEAGTEMRAGVERIEDEVAGLDRRVLGRDTRLSGSICVTLPGLFVVAMAPKIADFCSLYPGIEVELAVRDTYASLSRREADVAIRATAAPPESLVGRRVCRLAIAPYGGVQYLEANPDISDLRKHRWVHGTEQWRTMLYEKWIARHVPPEQVSASTNTAPAIQELIASGAGLAWLATYGAEPDPRIARVGDPVPEFASAIWILTHEDLRTTARVRRFMDFMAEAIAEERAVSEGDALTPQWAAAV